MATSSTAALLPWHREDTWAVFIALGLVLGVTLAFFLGGGRAVSWPVLPACTSRSASTARPQVPTWPGTSIGPGRPSQNCASMQVARAPPPSGP